MNKFHKRRLYLLVLFAVGLTLSAGLILFALKQNINVFLMPSEMSGKNVPGHSFRLGGIVKPGSIKREKGGLGVEFIVTDLKREQLVSYVGVLPDLFREGKGVIAEGSLNESREFVATEVLAKHDENYMPKNVYQAMREKVT